MDELFIEQIANSCIKYYDKYKILPSLTIAQAIKESNWNRSLLSSKYFNFFGMKWNKSCGTEFVELNTKEWDSKNNCYITVKAPFRKYNSYDEGIEGYYKFISGYKRYSNLIGELDSYTACINIQKDGWATAPTYGESLYKDYVIKYNLMKYDDIVLGRTFPIADNKIIDKNEVIYTVKKGDTLWSISQKFLGYGVKWRKIYDYNNLKTTVIRIGQELLIPVE